MCQPFLRNMLPPSCKSNKKSAKMQQADQIAYKTKPDSERNGSMEEPVVV
jgi:hypothetical protein